MLIEEASKFPPAEGKRFNFKLIKKPPFWFLTFWKERWKNYGVLVHVPPNSSEFETARYETKFIYDPKIIKNHPNSVKILNNK